MNPLVREIILGAIEGIILLGIFSVLKNDLKYIWKHKLNITAFLALFSLVSAYSTLYISPVLHTMVISCLAVLLISLLLKTNIWASCITYAVFFIVIATGDISAVFGFMILTGNDITRVLTNNMVAVPLVAKTLQIIFLLILAKLRQRVKQLNIFDTSSPTYAIYFLQISVVVILISASNYVNIHGHPFYHQLLLLGIFFILVLTSFLDLKERERLLVINSKYHLQESHIQQMEDVIGIMRKEKHDFGNHLNTIKAICHFAKPDALEKINNYIGKITEDIQMNSFKHYDTGNVYIDGILGLKGDYAREQEISLDVEVKERFDSLELPENELISIVSNLLDNAFEALNRSVQQKEKIVFVSTFLEQDKFVLEVANNGEVVPEEIQKKIFEKGYSTKLKGKDHGYGLYIIKQLVTKHRGEILFKSTTEETCFTIKFPRVQKLTQYQEVAS